ncbi:mannonate dehydratase [Treponema sp. OMZ 840]|uniref:mannonate dehydratase n=1 Tax=Treponema sp. OMZ 840 TaxID=244313 RepID=UPI003D8A6841
MEMTFRWYGHDDPVSLEYIRQIPAVTGIVSAVYDVPVGEVWPLERIEKLKRDVEAHGLKLSVIESVPVHEDIKLGKPSRDRYIENYAQTLTHLGKLGIRVVCYNFMPVFDWTRTNLNHRSADGSTSLIFEESIIEKANPLSGEFSLPGWDSSYTKADLKDLFDAYKQVDEEKLWENLNYFLQRIIPAAEKANVKMAIHPDDPPYNIFGLPRIITSQENLERFISLYDSPHNGLTMCAGSLGCVRSNDFVKMLDYFCKKDRVNFVHARNILLQEGRSFAETAHMSSCGSLDMFELINTLSKYNYSGPIRPDHGRMIWGETGKPGYGLYDRALGASYLAGLWEACEKAKKAR